MLAVLTWTIDDKAPVLGSTALNVTARSEFKTPQSPPLAQRRSVQILTFGADCVVRVVWTFCTTRPSGRTLTWADIDVQLPSLTLAVMVTGWSFKPWASVVSPRPVTVKAEPRPCAPTGIVAVAETWTLVGSELLRFTTSGLPLTAVFKLMLASVRCLPTPSVPTLSEVIAAGSVIVSWALAGADTPVAEAVSVVGPLL